MKRYGVKLNNGKLMWVRADAVECREGAVMFVKEGEGGREILAGFPLVQVNHWGLPEAFVTEDV